MIDIGGGSTEIIVAERGAGPRAHQPAARLGAPDRAARAQRSGARRASSRRSRGEVAAALAPVPSSRRRRAPLVGVAGTVTSLAAMALQLATYDPARVHGFRLDARRARRADRAARGIDAGRARADRRPRPAARRRDPGRRADPAAIARARGRRRDPGQRPRDPLGSALRAAHPQAEAPRPRDKATSRSSSSSALIRRRLVIGFGTRPRVRLRRHEDGSGRRVRRN